MCELSKVSPQSALYDLELEVYTESNGGSNFGFLSGSGANRFVAVYNEYKDPGIYLFQIRHSRLEFECGAFQPTITRVDKNAYHYISYSEKKAYHTIS